MKKFFYSVLAAATMLFATTSCSQEEEIVGSGTVDNGATQKVTFTVQMPDEGVTSRAIAKLEDGKDVEVGKGNMANTLIWALYESTKTDGEPVMTGSGIEDGYTSGEEGVHKKFKAEINMVKGLEYKVLFLAYNKENSAFDVQEKDNLKALKLKSTLKANQESYDAFTACHTHVAKTGQGETTVNLYRPFAQVNAATTVEDLDRANDLLATVTESELVIKQVPTQYNVLTGEATVLGDLTYVQEEILKKYPAVEEGHPNEDITVKDDETVYKYLTMAYVLAGATSDATQSMHNATFNFYRDNDETAVRSIEIPNLPIQRNWRTNLVGDLLTKTESFKIVIQEGFVDDHNIYEEEIKNVTTSEDLETALKQDLETIIVNLGEDGLSRAEGEPIEFKVNISAGVEKYYFGGAKTKTIIINGNGHIINFVHNNNDWNYIRCHNEDTKWFINNVHLTNSNHNDGPWNRHMIRFYNAVELKDVTSDKAIALFADSKLEGVKISDEHVKNSEMYALWIVPQGQTVDINNCEFTAHSTKTGDRGITINNYYQGSDVADVTLNVSNSTFVTQKKAAILYKDDDDPKYGGNEYKAIINWGEGNNISGVAADQVYPVWVDENSEAYFDNVIVTGCQKRMENAEILANGGVLKTGDKYEILNLKGLKWFRDAVNAGDKFDKKEVILACDINLANESWKPIGISTTFMGTFDGGNHTISNLTVTTENNEPAGFFGRARTISNLTIVNANISGTKKAGAIVGDGMCAVIENCHVDGGVISVTPNSEEKDGNHAGGITGYLSAEPIASIKNSSVKNLTITAYRDLGGITGTTTGSRSAIIENCSVENVTIIANQLVKYEDDSNTPNAGEIVGRISGTASTLTNNVATNVKVHIYQADEGGNVTVAESIGLVSALENGNDVTLSEDVKINPAGMSNAYGITGINVKNGQTIDGGGNTLDIKGAGGTWDSGINTTGGLIKNITVTGSFRGIFINHNSDYSEKVVLENVTIEGTTYTISCDQGMNQGLEATGCTFKGWTSYAATLGNAKFTGCYFGYGNGYSYCRPYAPTEFVGCEFEAGYQMDPRAAVTFENCTLDGVALTAENLATLVTSNIANATVK